MKQNAEKADLEAQVFNMDKIQRHQELLNTMHELYVTKNHDYGDSVHDTYLKYGLTSFLVRLEDKLNRARTISQKEQLVKDEKIKDTLLDLANYATLAVLELEWEESQRVQGGDTNN